MSYRSIPYTSIVDFAVETAGTFDTDAELHLHLSGGLLVSKEFKKGTDIMSVQQAIALAVLGSGARSRLWRIEGVDGKGNPYLGSFDAETEEEAVGLANDKGIMVSSCKPVK